MSAAKLLAAYGCMALFFLLVDLLWLGVFAKEFYHKQIGHLMAARVNWTAALIFYLIYIGGIMVFAVIPAHAVQSLHKALLMGAMLGFLAYATYDLTNWATLEGWPARMVVVDLIWGTILTGLTAGVGLLAAQRLF